MSPGFRDHGFPERAASGAGSTADGPKGTQFRSGTRSKVTHTAMGRIRKGGGMIWLFLLPAYALGTFPSAVMIARGKGVDITKVGSGNPGASNISRTFGKPWGVLVFVLDGLKGMIPAAVGIWLIDDRPVAYGMVVAAILGHMFPLTRRLRGGKGVATMAGAAFVLQPIVAPILAVLWYTSLKVSKKASVASIVVMVGLPVGTALKGAPGWEIATLAAINALVMVRHTENIKRLLDGTELSAKRPNS